MKSPNGFDIKFVFVAYVPPYVETDKSIKLKTEIIEIQNQTTEYLFKIFDSSLDEAKIEILFSSVGKQHNNIRTNILAIAQEVDISKKTGLAKKLAIELFKVTDERNGKGLFTIIVGEKAKTTRLVLIRFKGNEGLVSKGKGHLVDYISEVFTKKTNQYKLAVYEDILSDTSFWKGFSIDKQISGITYKSSTIFWIEKFLQSKTALTSAQGTMQFSKVLKTLLSKTDNISEQEEIISGIVNLKTKQNIQISVSDFCNAYLSANVSARLQEEITDDFFNSVFVVDSDVYKKEFGKTVLSLQDGITAYVPTFSYEKHVTEVPLDGGGKNIIIESKLQAKKINVQKKEKVTNEKRLSRNKK